LSYETPTQNSADRLRDGTDQSGERHAQAKLTDDHISEIRTRYAMGDVLQKELAAEYEVNPSYVSRIVNMVRRAS
jgi:DNA-binding MarR family transcriptional regulator